MENDSLGPDRSFFFHLFFRIKLIRLIIREIYLINGKNLIKLPIADAQCTDH